MSRNSAGQPRSRLSEYAYRSLLLLYPRDFRLEFAPSMLEAFRERQRRARANARPGWRLVFWSLIFRDLLTSVPRSRHDRALPRSGAASGGPQGPRRRPIGFGLAADLLAAARRLRRQPAFALMTVFIIALGISGTATVFSVVDGVLLRSLPYDNPGRIIRLWAELPAEGIDTFSFTKVEFRHFAENNGVFESIGGDFPNTLTVTGDGEPERLRAAFVTPGYFETFGVQPQLGRFIDFDDIDGGDLDIVVISHGLWQRRLGGTDDVVGRSLTLNGRAMQVVGVLPAGYRHLDDDYDAFIPYARGTGGWIGRWLGLSARLAPGVTLEQAQSNIDAMMGTLAEENERSSAWSVRLESAESWAIGNTRSSIVAIVGAVSLLLLLACANVANLLLARASTRQRETAVRLALGASRWQIARQHLAEGLVIGVGGGLLGTIWAYAALPLVVHAGGEALPRLSTIAVDTRVLAVAVCVSVLSGVLFGMAPALYAFGAARRQSFTPPSGVVGQRGAHRVLSGLIAAEVALALAVLVGAGLFLRSFQQLQNIDVGVDTDRVVSASISLPGTRYAEAALVHEFYDRLLSQVAAMPGVDSTSLAAYLPLDGEGAITSLTEGNRLAAGNRERVATLQRTVRRDFFQTMRIPLLRGRSFEDTPRQGAVRELIISESLAEMFWPGEDPIGKRVTSRLTPEEGDWREIIGVVGEVRYVDLESPQQPQMYESHYEQPSREMALVAHTSLETGAFAASLRRLVAQLDPQVPVDEITSMEQLARDAVAGPRFSLLVFVAFAATAVILACAGIYGVVSFVSGRQRREIGLRMALGATRPVIAARTLRRSFTPVAVGIALGLALAVGLSGVLATALHDISPLDPATYAIGAIILALVSLLACWVPSRRAAATDPMVAMRDD